MDNFKLASEYKSVKLPDLAFGKEWAILELVTLGLYSASEQKMFAELITFKDLDCQKLLQQATRHKISALLAFFITTNNYSEVIPSELKQQLETILFFNRHKINLYRSKAAEIVRALTKNKIKFVGTKGITLESTVYQSNGSRIMSDIDFMILPQDRKVVSQTLANLGYQMGTCEQQTGKIKPHSREIIINYKLNPDHLPTHISLIDDVIFPFIEVDIANSLTWTLCPFQIPTEIALENIVYQSIPKIKDVKLPSFIPQFQFIFTILHLFKEAWIELTLDINGKDVSLSKFGDVVRIWRVHQNELQNEEFVKILEEFNLILPVVWVLEHLDRTLQTNIVSSLSLEGRVTEKWLSSAASSTRKARQWRGTMRERLVTQNRRQLFRQ